MEQVFAKIREKDCHAALVHLWLLADRTVQDGETSCQQASLWLNQEQAQARLTLDLRKWLDQPDPDDWPTISQYPLRLLTELDSQLADDFRHSHALIEVSVEQQRYALVRRRFPPCPARRQAPHPRHWAPKHDVFPLSFSIGTGLLQVNISKPLMLAPPLPSTIRCRLSHFDDGITLQIEENPDHGSFVATGVSDLAARNRSLDAECQRSGADQVHFWVAPELTAPRSLQKAVARTLASSPQTHLLLVVPGSFHWKEGSGFRNGSDVVDGNGFPLFTHYKLTQFAYLDAQGRNMREGIGAARQIHVADTPLGLVCVVICKDFSDAGMPIIKAVLTSIAPDWLLVPSYGDAAKTLARHRKTACELETQCGTRSLIANQEPRIDGEPPPESSVPGFAHADKSTQPVAAGGTTLSIPIPPPPSASPPVATGSKRPQLQSVK